MSDFEVFDLGNAELLSGEILHDAKLVYKTYGNLSSTKDNVVVLPTFYTGTHFRNEGFFGPGRALDPARHFIICPNLIGNGLSTSPSNYNNLSSDSGFPLVQLWDNIAFQHKLINGQFGINKIALVAGWSMAGCQAYQWAAQFPDMVEAILPFCASAKTSPHNIVFLEGVKAALCADQSWNGGNYVQPPVAGLKAFARVYAGWAFSQTFYRNGLYKNLGFETFEELLKDWEQDHVENWDANDLLTKLATWQAGDISQGPLYNGNIKAALGAIKARAILMPCTQDLYFPPEDNQIEASHMPNAHLRPVASPWGHCAANPGNDPEFERQLDTNILELLNG